MFDHDDLDNTTPPWPLGLDARLCPNERRRCTWLESRLLLFLVNATSTYTNFFVQQWERRRKYSLDNDFGKAARQVSQL